jgi:aldose 1-epimerase
MKVSREVFGKLPDSREVQLFTVRNPGGLSMKISNYGGIIQSLLVPGKDGKTDDMVLGFDNLEGYLGDHPYIGTLVGRYANRIARGMFTLDGTEYRLAVNNGPNHLHGGLKGFDKVLWEASEFADAGGSGVSLSYLSPHSEEGYPGNLKVDVTFTLDAENRLCIEYRASTDRACPLNLTHHAYFNLGGGSMKIHDHELMIAAGSYVVSDDELIPTGEIRELDGGPLDFRTPKTIGKDIEQVEGGYDHCYVLDNSSAEPKLAARVWHPESGRIMEVFTTEPGMQFYSSNFLEDITGKGGQEYGIHQALCLETQHYPDSPNHPGFPETVLRPGETYTQRTIYKFSTM